ncbi:MAG: hypothetical protein E7271_08435 [Lachnospiraceae bacterium]|jgi:hypothetical protein|nr:hypothetical protein [Lachnospiraceae bacterium]
MVRYIILALLLIFLIYLIVWTIRLHSYNKRKKKVKRIKELRAKGNEIKKRTIDCTKDYWYNLREVEDCTKDEDFEKYYHYFIGVEQGVHDLLMEMYDCGIVRTDELEQIAYGSNHYKDVDLSFLEEFEEGLKEEGKIDHTSAETMKKIGDIRDSAKKEDPIKKALSDAAKDEEELSLDDGVIEIQGGLEEDFFGGAIIKAARNMKEDDPGITDIKGTLSEGVESVIAAVDEEKEEQALDDEPILPKKEKDVEEAMKAREATSNAAIRNKIYEKWVSYVFELYEMVSINANEDTKHKIRKALMDYGYNDVDVLLEDPISDEA